MLKLRHRTPPEWTVTALADLDALMRDHAHNERKVSQSALQLACHHPDKPELVHTMIAHAQEELAHFAMVADALAKRGKDIGFDRPTGYMAAVRGLMRRNDTGEYLLDRLLLYGIVEARGCEKFRLLAQGLPDGELCDFYTDFVRSEAQHHKRFLDLAERYFESETVQQRLDELLDAEADVARGLPLRAALY